MPDEYNLRARRGQDHSNVVDFLDAALRDGRPISREFLLALDVHEPLASPRAEDGDWRMMTPAERREWWCDACALRRQYPGYQHDHDAREELKYRGVSLRPSLPDDDAPLAEFVTRVLQHARAKWSRDLWSMKPRQQFRDWLPTYLMDRAYFWTPTKKMESALRLLRRAYGLPDFPPTTARQQLIDRRR